MVELVPAKPVSVPSINDTLDSWITYAGSLESKVWGLEAKLAVSFKAHEVIWVGLTGALFGIVVGHVF